MARIVVSDGSSTRAVELTDVITVVGRSSENKIAIEDKQASRKHCHFEKTDYGFKLVDLESRNGTRVNDRVVNQALLRPGDRVQIGKHVLTFEDPAFKEPPADVAARFAPPPLPSSAPAASAPPAPPPPPVPISGPDETAPGVPPTLRRRTGHTTSIDRIARVEREKERKLITVVAAGAIGFVVLLLVLMFLPSGGETPAVLAAKKTIDEANGLLRQGKLDEAQIHLGKVTPDLKEQHRAAQALLKQIEATRARKEQAESADALREFNELYEFCEKNRSNPRSFETVLQRCEAFKQKYPKYSKMSAVDEWLAMAAAGRKTARREDVAESERLAQEALKKDDFAGALRALKAGIDKSKEDLETRDRLVKIHDEAIDKAKTYSTKKRVEANDFASRGRRDEAVKILEALVIAMGDGNVEELADFALLARTTLQGLK